MILVLRRFLFQGNKAYLRTCYTLKDDTYSLERFFWKIVYDEKTKKGIAVIGTNNPHRFADGDDQR